MSPVWIYLFIKYREMNLMQANAEKRIIFESIERMADKLYNIYIDDAIKFQGNGQQSNAVSLQGNTDQSRRTYAEITPRIYE